MSTNTIEKSKSPHNQGLLHEIVTLIKANMREYGMYIALAFIIVYFTIATHGTFISSRNISNLINQTGYIVVLAVGMTLVIIIKHIDLSVGFVAGFTGAVAALLMTKGGLSEWAVIPMVLLIGVVIGIIFGLLIGKVGVPSFVVTLAGMLVFRGLLLLVTEGTGTIIVPNKHFNAIGNGFIPDIVSNSNYHILTLIIGMVGIICMIFSQIKTRKNAIKYNFHVISLPIFLVKLAFLSLIFGAVIWTLAGYKGLSWTVVIIAIVVIVYDFIMNKTPLGRYIYGVGGNGQAAELSGINVAKVTVFVFASMSMLAALSGILFTSRLQSASTTAGTGFELDAIAGAFVGGASANGGIGKITGSIVGAMVMMSLTNGMNLLGVGISYQYTIRGIILVAAVIFDLSTRKKKG